MDIRDRANAPMAAFDDIDNPGPDGADFERIAERVMSRRGFLGHAAAFGAAAFVVSAGALTPSGARAAGGLMFEPIAANSLDTITLPKGFSWYTLISWGDPLWSNGAEFDHATRGDGASQELAFGDNNDGMDVFTQDGRVILAVNNEYVNRSIIYGNRDSKLPENADDVKKGKAGHGVSVFEIKQEGGKWILVKDSSYNRRITADTPMDITGPARGHDLMKTAADSSGATSLGTWNNCGNGETPMGLRTWRAKKILTAISPAATPPTSRRMRCSATASRSTTGATPGPRRMSALTFPNTRTNPIGPATLWRSIP